MSARSSADVLNLPRPWPPRVIAFDGDDTLWHNETLFSMTQGRFRMLLLHHVNLPSTLIDARLAETAQRNLLEPVRHIHGAYQALAIRRILARLMVS